MPFSGYGFNKSHTAGYGMVSYWTAHLKANYPAEYMAALLTSVGDDKDRMAVYLAECRKLGIKVLPPDVNESKLDFAPVGTDIRFGLGAIRNVGAAVVGSIVSTRQDKGNYASFADFLDKSEIAVCNKRVVESLIRAGAFDSLGHTRKSLFLVQEQAVDAVIGVKRQEAIGQFDLFASVEAEGGGAGRQDRAGLPAHRRGMAAQAAAGPGAGDARPVRLGPPAGRRRADPAAQPGHRASPTCWPRAGPRARSRWPGSSSRSTGGSTRRAACRGPS